MLQIKCTGGESNPWRNLGRVICYHYTTGAKDNINYNLKSKKNAPEGNRTPGVTLEGLYVTTTLPVLIFYIDYYDFCIYEIK